MRTLHPLCRVHDDISRWSTSRPAQARGVGRWWIPGSGEPGRETTCAWRRYASIMRWWPHARLRRLARAAHVLDVAIRRSPLLADWESPLRRHAFSLPCRMDTSRRPRATIRNCTQACATCGSSTFASGNPHIHVPTPSRRILRQGATSHTSRDRPGSFQSSRLVFANTTRGFASSTMESVPPGESRITCPQSRAHDRSAPADRGDPVGDARRPEWLMYLTAPTAGLNILHSGLLSPRPEDSDATARILIASLSWSGGDRVAGWPNGGEARDRRRVTGGGAPIGNMWRMA